MEGPYRKRVAPVQIRDRLWMTCKAKAIAGGVETLYKRWRPDERAKGKREKQEKLIK